MQRPFVVSPVSFHVQQHRSTEHRSTPPPAAAPPATAAAPGRRRHSSRAAHQFKNRKIEAPHQRQQGNSRRPARRLTREQPSSSRRNLQQTNGDDFLQALADSLSWPPTSSCSRSIKDYCCCALNSLAATGGVCRGKPERIVGAAALCTSKQDGPISASQVRQLPNTRRTLRHGTCMSVDASPCSCPCCRGWEIVGKGPSLSCSSRIALPAPSPNAG